MQKPLDTVLPGRCWVTAQSPTVPKVYQPDKELSVNIGDSASLQCCNFGIEDTEIIWFKQQNGKQPQEYEEETLNYTPLQFSKKKAKAEKRKTGSSDECVYSDVNTTESEAETLNYAALQFSKRKIKAEEIRKPGSSDECVYSDVKKSVKFEFEGETLNYASLQFSKRKAKAEEKRKTGSLDECVYSDVKKSDYKDETLNYAALKFSKQRPKAEKRKTVSSVEFVYSDVNY
ncbi:hypothetical protein QTP86_007520 [Hemibagrus guttatus]|nr:hypothetical protein QTP86_007520 [Hemibagrus guttatus]